MRYAIFIPLIFSACATFPALDGTISDAARQAPYPDLTPLPPLPTTSGEEDAVFQARIDALQARAARLRKIEFGALQ